MAAESTTKIEVKRARYILLRFIRLRRRLSWRHLYAVLSVLVLISTTIWWALLGARIQQTNADQLVNTFLFENAKTFHQALFPSAHSFLLKWPIFWLIHMCHGSTTALQLITVLLCLTTVLSLAYILHRIERRWLVWGTLLLALSSILLLVPTEPYAGGLLPVNMAMLATRNIEYLVYIAGLMCLIKWPKMKKPGLWIGLSLLGLLFASDRLFLTMSVSGAAIAGIVYLITRQSMELAITKRWLVATLAAIPLSAGVLWLVNASGLTHISSQSDSPFMLVSRLKDLELGAVFGLLHIFTNFGANPVFDAAEFKDMPHLLHQRLLSPSGPSFVINAALLTLGAYCTVKVTIQSIMRFKPAKDTTKRKVKGLSHSTQLALLLIWSTLASWIAFVVTKHYYVVDARYLTISLFAVLIATATHLRTKKMSAALPLSIGAILGIAICLGGVGMVRTYRAEQAALQATNQRNSIIITALGHRPARVLVGDYWRVLPIKAQLPNQTILPLDACNQPRQILSSRAWQPLLHGKSFAYILSLDKSLTNYPHCDLQSVLKSYGMPSQTLVVDGQPDKPTELLLYFDQTSRHPKLVAKHTNTVLPINLQDYSYRTCSTGKTVMNIVAHQDDDLLFTSPDLLKAIDQGDCIRTVYVTAGDSGQDNLYWLAREQGSEAAYNTMLHSTTPWVRQTIKLAKDQFIVIANPQDNNRISLIFMHLPDGNLHGEGFANSHRESLTRLERESIPLLHSVDNQSVYSLKDLQDGMLDLITAFQPSVIHTQASYNASRIISDHSDHIAVGRLVETVATQLPTQPPDGIFYYVGYPIRTKQPNISKDLLQAKLLAFLAYARFDGAVCQSQIVCGETLSYGNYLKRQYTTSQYESSSSLVDENSDE